jgi:two-component system cell cycle response regulator DivK
MQRTILLAEDHEDNRMALLTVLEHDGYRTLAARNGAEAVDLAREHAPDLVVMDLAMPVMDGKEAMKVLKADPATAGIPIIVLTAMALSIDGDKLRGEGFDGFLAKPCMPPSLLQEVRKYIGPANGS